MSSKNNSNPIMISCISDLQSIEPNTKSIEPMMAMKSGMKRD